MVRLCPHCGTKSRFDKVFPNIRGSCNDENGFHYIERCQDCRGIVYSIWNVDLHAPLIKTVVSGGGAIQTESEDAIEKFSYPFISMSPPFNISDSFEKSFIEGVKCLNVGAPFAAVVMFRKCLQMSLYHFSK